MWAIVKGEVTNTFFEGKGLKVKETFTKRDGTEGSNYYSVFFEEPHGLDVGERGTFQGPGTVKAEEHDGQWWGRLTVNNARFEPEDSDAF